MADNTVTGTAKLVFQGSGMPVYVGARAKVSRIPEGIKIWLSDYKGTSEEIIEFATAAEVDAILKGNV